MAALVKPLCGLAGYPVDILWAGRAMPLFELYVQDDRSTHPNLLMVSAASGLQARAEAIKHLLACSHAVRVQGFLGNLHQFTVDRRQDADELWAVDQLKVARFEDMHTPFHPQPGRVADGWAIHSGKPGSRQGGGAWRGPD